MIASAVPRMRAVVVGAGLMGRWHAAAARRVGAHVSAVVDRDTDRARGLARRHAGASVHADLSTVPAAAGLTVVHVCTSLDSHVPLALEALDAGYHVLVEKPEAPDNDSLDLVLRLAARRSLLVCPVHQFIFQRGLLRLTANLPSLGTLRHLEMEIASTGAEQSPSSRDDVALEILPHGLALAARLCGPGVGVASWAIERSSDGELAFGTSVGATRVSIRISMRGRPPANRLRLVADAGTVEADLFNGFAVWDRTGATRSMKLLRPLRSAMVLGAVAAANLVARVVRSETAYPGLRELVRQFYLAAAGEGTIPIPTEESRAVTAAWSKIRHSLTSRTPATLSADLSPTR